MIAAIAGCVAATVSSCASVLGLDELPALQAGTIGWEAVGGMSGTPTESAACQNFVGLGAKILAICGTTAWAFDGRTWAAIAPPPPLGGQGTVVRLGEQLMLYYNGATWTYSEAGGWVERSSGGSKRVDSQLARESPTAVLEVNAGSVDLWRWSDLTWSLVAPKPTRAVGSDVDRFSIRLFNLSDALYALDRERRTHKWTGSDWQEIGSAATAPAYTGSRSVFATDGVRTVMLGYAGGTHRAFVFDGADWRDAGGITCPTGVVPSGIANIGTTFYVRCAGETGTPWAILRWAPR